MPFLRSVLALNGDAILCRTYAAFLDIDKAANGNWKGVYGLAGPFDSGDTQSFSFVSAVAAFFRDRPAAVGGEHFRCSRTADLQCERAASWDSGSQFTLALPFTDKTLHKVSFYSANWDGLGGGQTIQIIDAPSGVVLAEYLLTGFHEHRTWVSFVVSESVIIRVRITTLSQVPSSVGFSSIPTSRTWQTTTRYLRVNLVSRTNSIALTSNIDLK
jgi:hypothetical protein